MSNTQNDSANVQRDISDYSNQFNDYKNSYLQKLSSIQMNNDLTKESDENQGGELLGLGMPLSMAILKKSMATDVMQNYLGKLGEKPKSLINKLLSDNEGGDGFKLGNPTEMVNNVKSEMMTKLSILRTEAENRISGLKGQLN